MSLTGRYALMGGLFLFFSLAVGLGGDPLMHASLPATVGFLALMLACVLAVAAVVDAVVNRPAPGYYADDPDSTLEAWMSRRLSPRGRRRHIRDVQAQMRRRSDAALTQDATTARAVDALIADILGPEAAA